MAVDRTIHSDAGSHTVPGHLAVGMGSLPQQLSSHWVQNTARIQLRGGEKVLEEEEGTVSGREESCAYHHHLQ